MRRPRLALWPITTAAAATLLLFWGSSACQLIPPLPQASTVPSGAPTGLSLRWFGTSTVIVSDGSSTVMVDGFFSRLSKPRLLFAATGLPLVRPDEKQLIWAQEALKDQPVNAIFVAHSHHDHVLDVPRIAAWKDSIIYGSQSTKHVVDGNSSGLTVKVVRGGQWRCIGRFKVTILESPHKTSFIAQDGEITRPLRMPTGLTSFRSGPSFAFLVEHPNGSVLIIPSAVLSPARPPRYPPADVVLLGTGMLGREPSEAIIRYWASAVSPGRTKRVHPVHWDDFTRPLSDPLRPFPLDRTWRSIDIFKALASSDVELSYLPLAKQVRLPAYAGPAPAQLGCPDVHMNPKKPAYSTASYKAMR